ncbi:hypothetical protein Maes01_02330 [Microbulbifer aestuariivivens]|uniref:Autotransporter domain-containing protein n=1 Tax=Microbulbifer aestuariivivens TaxID=1908308 RepID=A0ABP9WRB2_9GAMM
MSLGCAQLSLLFAAFCLPLMFLPAQRALAQIANATGTKTQAPHALPASIQIPNGPVSTPQLLALHSQIKALAQQLSLQEVAGYQQRPGNAGSSMGTGAVRLFHRSEQLSWSGDIRSRFDGQLSGIQLDRYLYSGPTCRGTQQLGLLAGSSIARGDVTAAFPEGEAFAAGRNTLTSYYGGLYFSDYRQDQSYIDVMAKVSYLTADTESIQGLSARIRGPQVTLSAERSIAISVREAINLEPQLQLIANHTNLHGLLTKTDYLYTDMTPELALRSGLRAYPLHNSREIYAFANYWVNLGGKDGLLMHNGKHLNIERGARWGELGGGLTLLNTKRAAVFLSFSYRQSLDGPR